MICPICHFKIKRSNSRVILRCKQNRVYKVKAHKFCSGPPRVSCSIEKKSKLQFQAVTYKIREVVADEIN